jgi:hypothetical protein
MSRVSDSKRTARIEFVATVERLPVARFLTKIGSGPWKVYNPSAPPDTVGMFRPFSISYNGVTTNGQIRAFRFFPLTSGVSLVGENEWSTDLTDTLRVFPNVGPDAIPSGELRLATQVQDDAGAESPVDAAGFTQGVARVVVNFEPDTEIYLLQNTYFKGTTKFVDSLAFGPGAPPDTVPYGSWVRVHYDGWDNPADSSLCTDVLNECISYQLQYTRIGEIDGGPLNGGSTIESTIRWVPDDTEDNNPAGTSDSTSLNVGSERYRVRVRSVDEYGKPDGTHFGDGMPIAQGGYTAQVEFIGNFSPTLDSFSLENYDGVPVSDGGTLPWRWTAPANMKTPPTPADTLDFSDPSGIVVQKVFFFVMKAVGHDAPKEPLGAGVKSWLYVFRRVDDPLIIEKFNRSGVWTDGLNVNAFADTFRLVVRYPFGVNDTERAQNSSDALAIMPSYLNKEYTYSMRGRDLSTIDEFEQFIFLLGDKVRQNSFNTSTLGRLTENKSLTFTLTLEP